MNTNAARVLRCYMPPMGKARVEYFRRDEEIKNEHRERLRALKDIHSGKKAFIIGNAPSVAQMDLTKLKNHVTFAVNSTFLLYDKMGFQANYTCVSDRIRWHELREKILPASEQSRIFYCDDWEFPTPVGLFSEEERKKITLLDQLYALSRWAHFFAPVRNQAGMFTYGKLKAKKFSHDIAQGICLGNSVIFMATQLAAYMGCNPIVLLGVEMNYDQQKTHFHGEKIWTPPMSYEKDARPWFVLFRKTLESRGIEWINATIGGNVDVLERKSLENFLTE
ncbi:MAG: hypothetical protein ACOY3I_08130 [Verrucomicrobiota bacterium]